VVFSIGFSILIAWFIIVLLKKVSKKFQNNRVFDSHKILVGAAIFIMFSEFGYAELDKESKKTWEKSFLPECIKIQTESLYNRNISQSDIKKYCQCLSNQVVERATVHDANNSTNKMYNIMNDASILCAGKYILSK
jgi:hypothetical protein